MPFTRFLTTTALGILVSTAWGDPPDVGISDSTSRRLFVITRSLNTNEVVYEVRLWPHGVDVQDPIRIYWNMKAEGGGYQDLNGIERSTAYGATVQEADEDHVVFSVKAIPDRLLTVRRLEAKHGVGLTVTTTINKQDSYVDGIFIKTQGRGIFTKAMYVNLNGRRIADGKPVTERIDRD